MRIHYRSSVKLNIHGNISFYPVDARMHFWNSELACRYRTFFKLGILSLHVQVNRFNVATINRFSLFSLSCHHHHRHHLTLNVFTVSSMFRVLVWSRKKKALKDFPIFIFLFSFKTLSLLRKEVEQHENTGITEWNRKSEITWSVFCSFIRIFPWKIREKRGLR